MVYNFISETPKVLYPVKTGYFAKENTMRRFNVLCLLVLLSFISISTIYHFTSPTYADIYNNQIIVKLRPTATIEPIASQFGLTIIDRIDSKKEYLLSVPLGINLNLLILLLKLTLGVDKVEPNTIVYSLAQPSGFTGDRPTIFGADATPYTTQQLNSFLQLNSVSQYSQGQTTKVAVIDTGIDVFHPVLDGHIAQNGYDYVDQDNIAYDELGGSYSGHGTFISGLILLIAPQAQILPIRALATNGTGDSFHIGEAIYYAADNGANVINLSLGTDEETGILYRAITYANSKGCMVVAAMGNENSGTNTFPASYTNVLGIAATDFNDQKASFSNYGSAVSVTAPGVNLVSAFPGGFYACWSGTSFSTAIVSAQASLLLAQGKNKDITASIIKTSSTPLNQSTYQLGYGRINILRSVSEY